ncbi:MAG: dihydroorotate dehydrogenase 2 [Betaproteobacteria bacterium]|nr:dihydroorotate dehydrogenase 2 [Betaproteobacteria bacterium]
MLYALARPLLFALDPETAHSLTFALADAPLRLGLLRFPRVPLQPVRAMGLEFPNPVGLAAGLDKNAEHVDALGALGFGFLEVGTVTPRPQAGNPRPRFFRLPKARALINRLGFNNVGLDAFLENLSRARWRGVLGINIGRNFDTPNERAADDYCACLERVYARASAARAAGRPARPARAATLKVSPDLESGQIREIAAAVRRYRIDALIATNTSLSREGIEHLALSKESGGVSGEPLRKRATDVLAAFAAELKGEVPLIGVGGILSGADAVEKLAAGASLVQLYTGLIYRGPELVSECARAIVHAYRAAA